MQNKIRKMVSAVALMSASLFANAAFLSVNDISVNALTLNETLESFYGFDNWQANTGLEVDNELVAFFAIDSSDELGFYMIFGGPSGNKGVVNFDIIGNNGEVTFVDESRDKVQDTTNGTKVKFTYGAGFTDGLIYSNFIGDDWELAIDFGVISGVTGFSFLSFGTDGDATTVLSDSPLQNFDIASTSSLASATSVSTPGTLAIFAVGLVGVGLYRRKTI